MSTVQIRCWHRAGFEVLVGCEGFEQIDTTLARLVEEGYRPLPTGGNAGESQAAPGAKAPSCPQGHGAMRLSKKYKGGWYCPEREGEDGPFCSETVRGKK